MLGSTLRSEPRRRSRGRHRSKWTPHRLSGLRAWYDAELGQPKYMGVGAYVQLDGASTDNISTPDSGNVDIAGDIEVIMRVNVTDWSAAAIQTLCGKYLTTGNQRSWRFYTNTAGNIGLTASSDGTAVTTITVTPTTPLPDATWIWIRMRLDLTNGANSVGTVDIAADTGDNEDVPTSWTANGTNTSTTIASVFNGTGLVEIGSFNSGMSERLTGQVGRCIIRDGFDGPAVADFNASKCYGPGYTEGLPVDSNYSKYVPLYGRNTDYIYTADTNSLDITGDLEVVMRVSLADWSPSTAIQTLICKDIAGPGTRSWHLTLLNTGALRLYYSPDGSAFSNQTSNAILPFSNDATGWIKVTRNASTGVVSFYYAADSFDEPAAFTSLGTPVTGAGHPLVAVTSPLQIGLGPGTTSLTGKIYRAIVRDGIDGTTVADYNAELADGMGFEDTHGNVWWHNNRKSTTWTLGIPKIYDVSGNGVAPAVFGAGTNQPTWLPWYGVNKVRTEGGAGNAIQYTMTDWTPLDTLVDFDVWADVEFHTLTPAASQSPIIERRRGVDPENQFRFCLNNAGTLSFVWFPLGTNASAITRTTSATLAVATGIQVNERIALRATLDVDDGAGNHIVTFYYRRGGYTGQWTLLEQIVTAGTTSTPTSGYANRRLEFGGGNATNSGDMTFYTGRVLSGIGGSVIATFDASNCRQSGYTNEFGHTITLLRAATGAKLVVQNYLAAQPSSVILHATDDWIDVPAAAIPALDTYAAASSVTAVFRRWHNPGAAGHAIFTTKANFANNALGFSMRMTTSAASASIAHFVGDAATTDGAETGTNAPALGVRAVQTANVGSSSPFVSAFSNGLPNGTDTARATTVSTSTGAAGRIGAYLGGTGAIDMEFQSLLCRNVGTSELEHDRASQYFDGGR